MTSVEESLASLRQQLEPFEIKDLAQRVGALLLMPENAGNAYRLEVAASLVQTLPPTAPNSPRVSDRRWRKFWDSSPLSDAIRRSEDPPCNPFTEDIVFFGGSFTVLPGRDESAAFNLRTLLKAIFLSSAGELSEEFIESSRAIALAGLAISNACAEKAGLRRNERPASAPTSEIVRPESDRFKNLKAATAFTPDELADLLADCGSDQEALQDLCRLAGDVHLQEIDSSELPVYRAPFVRVFDDLIVIAPTCIPFALTHAIVSNAKRTGDLTTLAERYREALFASTEESLKRLGAERLGPAREFREDEVTGVSARYSLDRDKLLVLLLITDDLSSFDEATTSSEWISFASSDPINRHIRQIESRIAAQPNAPNEVAVLIVIGSIGRGAGVGLEDFRFVKPMIISVDSLRILAEVETGKRLRLWQFVEASNRVRDRSRVLAFDPLDEFAVWKSNNYSYYSSDEALPTHIVVQPGSATALKVDAAESLDVHAAPTSDGRGVLEVMRFHDRGVPVYTAHPSAGEPFGLFVEGLVCPLWVEALTWPGPSPATRSLVMGFIDMIAYWTWQFADHLETPLRVLSQDLSPVVLEVEVQDSAQWHVGEPMAAQAVSIEPSERGLRVTFFDRSTTLLARGDNSGEREIVGKLVAALHRVTTTPAEGVDEEAINDALDRFAPLGPKKKLYFLRGEPGVLLDERDLPAYRPLQAPARDQWRDQENVVLERIGLSSGEIASKDRVKVLNSLVAELFGEFERYVSSMNPQGLIDWLVAQDERLIQVQEQQHRTLPARIACFSSVPEVIAELVESGPLLATTAISHRFLVEYVVAQPPSGIRPFSLSAYDELVSLASLIIGWAQDSDAIRYGISDTRLTVLGSGRLGRHLPDYDNALGHFTTATYGDQLSRSSRAFAGMWDAPAEGQKQISMEEFQVATRIEFGVSLEEMAAFWGALIDLGETQDGPVKRGSEAEIRIYIGDALHWPDERIDSMFSLFMLCPRESFLGVPDGFSPSDVYPWKFGRRLSYLARPLLCTTNGADGREFVWGNRALVRANEYLFREITSGHYIAQSDEMKSLTGRITNLNGQLFNDRVANELRSMGGLIVHTRVSAIANQRMLRTVGQPLGDIDVLGVDPERRLVFALETKDFSPARNPLEYSREGDKLDEAVRLHLERVAWLEARMPQVIRWLGLEGAPSEWRVCPAIVVSEDAFTARMRELVLPVWTVSKLAEAIVRAGRSAEGRSRGRRPISRADNRQRKRGRR